VAQELGIPHVEIDSLFHGPDWTPRESFEADVRQFSEGPRWVTEWQYGVVRQLLAERADLLVWLDLSRATVMYQVTRRTLRRRLHHEVLWNGNVEAPLRTVLTDRQHIVRWAWTTHDKTALKIATLREQLPELPIVRLTSRSDARRWLDGPLRQARCSTA
jgi:adenylate kinase family enzyme